MIYMYAIYEESLAIINTKLYEFKASGKQYQTNVFANVRDRMLFIMADVRQVCVTLP